MLTFMQTMFFIFLIISSLDWTSSLPWPIDWDETTQTATYPFGQFGWTRLELNNPCLAYYFVRHQENNLSIRDREREIFQWSGWILAQIADLESTLVRHASTTSVNYFNHTCVFSNVYSPPQYPQIAKETLSLG